MILPSLLSPEMQEGAEEAGEVVPVGCLLEKIENELLSLYCNFL